MLTHPKTQKLRTFLTCSVLAFITFFSLPALAQDCGCDYTITPSQTYIKASNIPAIKPGSTVCIKAGIRGRLKLIGFKGTADNPITFKNCGGKVIFDNTELDGTFVFENSRYFRVTGTGDSNHEYGFLIRTARKGSAMYVTESDFEVDHIEIADAGFAGIMAKIDPNCSNTQYHRRNFVMRNISVHDNYIHHTKGEGLYIGSTYYMGNSSSCGTLYPHLVEGLRVYNNRVEHTDADGIQISSASKDVEVYNNSIYRYGQDPFSSSQNIGLLIGGGSTGKYYNNKVIEGTGMGINSFGVGDVYIYNNLVVKPGWDGIFFDERSPLLPNSGFHAYNNTIVSPGRDGIRMQSVNSVGNTFYNNLIVAPASLSKNYYYKNQYLYIINSSVKYTQSNNLFIANVADAKFVNPAGGNYFLQKTSPAVEKGKILGKFNYDLAKTPRPKGNTYDIGAYEYSGDYTTTTTNATPTANAGSDKSITLPTNSVKLYGSASDSDGTVASTTWVKVNGPSCSMSGTTTKTLSLTKLLQGTYTFRLTVKDNAGASKSDDVVVTVNPAPTTSAAPTTASNGLSYKYYTGSSRNPWKVLPNFSALSPVKTGIVNNFTLSPKTQNDYFGFVFEGQIQIDAAGTYTFYTYSDDGTQLFINGSKVVDNNGMHGAQERKGSVYLAAGKHNIKLDYFEYTYSETLSVRYAGPGISKRLIPDNKLFPAYSSSSMAVTTVPVEDKVSDPAAPANLTAQYNSTYKSARLYWSDKSYDEEGFIIYMSEGNNSSYKEVGSTGANETNYTLVNLASNKAYYFKVKARFNKGKSFSAYSNEAAINAGADINLNAKTASVNTAGTQQPQAEEVLEMITEVVAYPNPITDHVNIELGGDLSGSTSIQLLDTSGKIHLTEKVQASQQNLLRLDLSRYKLQPGLYLLRVSNGLQNKTIKLLKE